MATRGQETKANILKVLEQVFPNMFSPDGKEYRIPATENGEPVEIKIALTCAKDNIGSTLPMTTVNYEDTKEILHLTEDEINNVKDLIQRLGL